MTLPVDWGEDLFNDGDIAPVDRIVSGFEALAQALLRRLDTPAGSLPDDDDGDYGYDITLLLSDGMTESDLNAVAARVEHEFAQDERVVSAKVTGKINLSAMSIHLTCAIVARDRGPFSFVLAISDVAKTILSIGEEAA
jgi:hypothetical protein